MMHGMIPAGRRPAMSDTTKGASNHYGNARGGSQGNPTVHTNYAWAKGFNNSTLEQHFEKHGSQMGAAIVTSYAAKAVSFANTVDRKNNVSFVDSHGSTYKYNKARNTLAIITKKGIVVTYYKPKEGYSYYLKEKKEKSVHGRKK